MFTEQLTQALSLAANPTHAAAQTASFNSNSVDLSKFERCLAILDIGAVTGTSPTFDAKWQESPDNSAWSDVAGFSNLSITQITTGRDRKSTRLNSSHSQISYAVFCLKKKQNK